MMKIKSQNLLRLLLLTPYVAWGMAVLFSRLVYGPAENPNTPNAILNALAGAATVYAVGIILWGIPYTLLALGLLIWSRKKSASVIYKVFVFSPILLSLLTAVEAALVSFSSQQSILINLQNFLSYAAVLVVPSLAFGYFFIIVAFLLYKALSRLNILKAETEPSQI
jgi:hypothetical protein